MLQLIEDYKKHIATTELKNEVYKWELVSNFGGRPNLGAADLYSEIKAIPYGNLLYQMSISALYELAKDKPEEMRAIFKALFNEQESLSERTKNFVAECDKLYQEFGTKRKHNQDERSISTYLTVYNPEKYTFYKSSFYKKICKLFGVAEAKKNEKYSHYLKLIDDIITNYIQKDTELIAQVKSYIPEYYDGTNNLILAQDILYQMLDSNPKETSPSTQEENLVQLKNVKTEFIEWMIANDAGRHYFSRQFGSNRVRFESEINEYEDVYKKNFNGELFIIDIGNIARNIEIIKQNIYEKNTQFAEYNNAKATGRPTAILGNSNYLQFLNNYLIKDQVTQKSEGNEVKYPLNQILYGPPGTGKTYRTVLKAAKIVSGDDFISYDQALKIFNDNLGNQIEFITFHQNYSYEDFIQGLRPDTENGSALTFEKKDGVFKRIADRALKNLEASVKAPNELSKEILFEKALDAFKDSILDVEDKYALNESVYIFEIDNEAFRYTGTNWEKHVNGIRMKFSDLREFYKNDVKSRKDIKALTTISGLANQHATYYLLVYQAILKFLPVTLEEAVKVECENFVIIIDEINRANISRVFGELITLIEEDKRSHGKIPMRVTLPSGDSFIVPSNLYIIGTMNTADKSIALLDIALRRRFEFIPMYPNLEVDGINDRQVLSSINKAILDRKNHDFTIGHSYFMGDSYSREKTINNKVIPLLLEYFMNDEKEVIAILKEANLTIGNWPLKLIVQND